MSISRIAVVGAGVVGLSTALHITERFPALAIHLVSKEFSPNITSDKSGQMLMPYELRSYLRSQPQSGETEYKEKVKCWTRSTFSRFDSLFNSEVNAEVQICLRFGYQAMYDTLPSVNPWFTDCLFGFRHVHPQSREAALANLPSTCSDVWAFSTYISSCTKYLQWMMRKFQANGGTVEKRQVKSLGELSDYDVIINCTGLGASDLVPEHDMKPCRGQTILVKAPWVSTFVADEDGLDAAYILPRSDAVVLGGTAEIGNFSEEVDAETTKIILEKCTRLVPSLKKAEILRVQAGLRPLRSRVRLDTEVGPTGGLVIHCYGHGGQGVVLSWGCAEEIGDIVQHYQ